jgi:hypothetical protein
MKKKCVFIIGPESSGSTLIAQIISAALNGDTAWSGRGFNCCDSAFCDRQNDFSQPCSKVEHLVCHRSLPFGLEPEWPPIEEWQSKYDAYFVLCTRDSTVSALSVKKRFQRKPNLIADHQNEAKKMITEVLRSDAKSFLWSYETFMFLNETYLQQVYCFLGLKSDYVPAEIKDANPKYIDQSALNPKKGLLRSLVSSKRR